MVRNMTFTERIADVLIVLILAAIALTSLFPIVHNLAVSLSQPAQAAGGYVSVLPKGLNWEAYKKIMDDHKFFNSFLLSVRRVAVTTVFSFIITVMMAYPLSRQPKEFSLRNVYMWGLIFVMMFHGGMVPFYLVIKKMGLMNSFWVLVLPMLVNVFNVILVVNYFRSVPKELDESANMDGAGPWYKLFRIYVPLSAPVLATTTLFLMVNVWNEFTLGMLFINNGDSVPLQTYMQSLIVTIDPTLMNLDEVKRQSLVSEKTLSSAKIFVSMLPILVVYPMLQKYFITGIMLGSVKE